MTQTNPWRLLILLLAIVAIVGSVVLNAVGDRELVEPLQGASLVLALLWVVVSAICWEIRRR